MLTGSCFCFYSSLPELSRILDLHPVLSVPFHSIGNSVVSCVPAAPNGFTLNVHPSPMLMREEPSSNGRAHAVLSLLLLHPHPHPPLLPPSTPHPSTLPPSTLLPTTSPSTTKQRHRRLQHMPNQHQWHKKQSFRTDALIDNRKHPRCNGARDQTDR